MVLLSCCRGRSLASALLLLVVLFPEVRGDCGPPKSFPNTHLRPNVEVKPSSPVGTRVAYACTSGYEPAGGGQLVSVCLETSEWSEISCQGRRCPVPEILNGRIAEDGELRLGAQITFVCDEGYRPIGQTRARCVLRSGSVIWDHDPPHCQRIPCLPPPVIANGNYRELDDYTFGTAVTYRCDSPYSLIGAETLVCRSDKDLNGEWSAPAPECKEVRCRTPEVPNGVMKTAYQPSYMYQHRVVFGCAPGYRLKDNRGDITCGADSTWQPRLPECILGVEPTTSSGGGGTSAGTTVQTPVRSTVNPMEETTKTEIGHTETPELPPDEPGSPGSSGSPVVGAVVGASIALVALIVVTVACRARQKRKGKTISGSAPPESYAAVPHNPDIPLEEQAKPVKV